MVGIHHIQTFNQNFGLNFGNPDKYLHPIPSNSNHLRKQGGVFLEIFFKKMGSIRMSYQNFNSSKTWANMRKSDVALVATSRQELEFSVLRLLSFSLVYKGILIKTFRRLNPYWLSGIFYLKNPGVLSYLGPNFTDKIIGESNQILDSVETQWIINAGRTHFFSFRLGIGFHHKIGNRLKFCFEISQNIGFTSIANYHIFRKYNSSYYDFHIIDRGNFMGTQFGISYLLGNNKEQPMKKRVRAE